jgi:hypothetical protein
MINTKALSAGVTPTSSEKGGVEIGDSQLSHPHNQFPKFRKKIIFFFQTITYC